MTGKCLGTIIFRSNVVENIVTSHGYIYTIDATEEGKKRIPRALQRFWTSEQIYKEETNEHIYG